MDTTNKELIRTVGLTAEAYGTTQIALAHLRAEYQANLATCIELDLTRQQKFWEGRLLVLRQAAAQMDQCIYTLVDVAQEEQA